MSANAARPSDDQIREVITATHYCYFMGEMPAGLSDWAQRFVDGDGGTLKALGQLLIERARFEMALEALFQICVELGISTEPDVSGAQMFARAASLDGMLCRILDEVRDYRREAEEREWIR
ncbi:hypothetical protein [Nocardia sp. NPDC057030]|uniref:hypothetical protein n=1 Tax=unclassified Nocardia TaxID=2637762 RepID=UPI00364434CD